MKKLTIEHLAAYLPYGVRVVPIFGGYAILDVENIGRVLESDKPLKLILHPLSDLTREITHNGETFVPIIEMAKVFHVNASNAVTHYMSPRCSSDFAMVHCCVDNNDNRYLYYEVFLDALKNKYQEIKYLHSLHFDTFGLIEAGLAVDINELKK